MKPSFSAVKGKIMAQANKWTPANTERLIERFNQLLAEGVTPLYDALHAEFDFVTKRSLERHIAKLQKEGRLPKVKDKTDPSVMKPFKTGSKITEGDDGTVTYSATTCGSIKTLKELVALDESELKDYTVTEFERNKWDVHMRDENKKVVRRTNWQVKAKYKLRNMQDAAQRILDDMTARVEAIIDRLPPEYVDMGHRPKLSTTLLEIGLFDLHLGNLSWHEETGENWNMEIAEEVFKTAISDLLKRARAVRRIDRILFPIGNDFFHADSKEAKTTAGTQMDLDTRWAKLIDTGLAMHQWAIDQMRRIAPVDVIVVPGNHDEHTMWMMGKWLGMLYRNMPMVHIHNEPKLRKYYRWGKTLLGFTHGAHEQVNNLPLIMAKEAKQDWARADFHEMHLGHVHHRKGMRFLAQYEDHDGVLVRILPTLTATDDWHYKEGHVGATRAAEAYVYDHEAGLVASLHHQRLRNS